PRSGAVARSPRRAATLPRFVHNPCVFKRHAQDMTATMAVRERQMSDGASTNPGRRILLGRAWRLLPQRWGTRAAAIAALLVFPAGSLYGVRAWTASSAASGQYIVATVERGDLEDTVTATAILQPRDFVDVGTQVSGQLKALRVEIGSTVKAGQLIAEIDPTVYLSKVEADQAQLRTQQAQLVDRQA